MNLLTDTQSQLELGADALPSTTASAAKSGDPRIVKRLREAADSLRSQAGAKQDPAIAHQRVTARRTRIEDSMAREGRRLERLASILDALADAREAGTLPACLDGMKTRASLESVLHQEKFPDVRLSRFDLKRLLESAVDPPPVACQVMEKKAKIAEATDELAVFRTEDDIMHLEALLAKATDKWGVRNARDQIKSRVRLQRAGIVSTAQLTEVKDALAKLETPPPSVPPKQLAIQKMERDLIGLKIPGYFPTPAAVVDLILQHADLQPGQRVLEPGAGKGSIADVVRERYEVQLDVCEISSTLRAILEAKEYRLVASDFLQYREGGYARIVMNPPFEQMQDVDHIRHAFDLLAPGGRLVSIASPGPFFRDIQKATDFRAWLDNLSAHYEKLPEGSFLDSDRSTSVSAYLVVVDKPTEASA